MATTTAAPTHAAAPPAPYVLQRAKLARFLWESRHDPLEPICRLPGAPGIVRIPDPFAEVFFVRSPQDARHVLIANQDAYGKGTDYRVLGVLLGNGLLTNPDLVFWQRQRKLVQPMFAKRHLAPMGAHMTAAATDWLRTWEAQATDEGIPVEAHQAMNALTLDVVDRALFGVGIDDDTTQVVGRAMTDVLHAGSYYLRTGWMTRALMGVGFDLNTALKTRPRPWRQAMRAIDTLDGVVAQLIAAYEADPDPDPHNLLALLLSARDEETGEPMSREQVRDEVMTFLGAGHETTANALSWMFLLLSQHPHVREHLQAEVDEVLQGGTPTPEDVDRLPYTMAVFQEAMRLYPPVPAVSRVALEDDVVGGVRVPKGSGVLVFPYVIHRDPHLWPNPEGFDPRRFLSPELGGTMTPDRPKQAFMPFGAGRRICVGNGFALMEGVLLAAMISQRFELDLQSGVRITPEIAITLRPEGGLPMVLRRRSG
jgi:cytochrome P450